MNQLIDALSTQGYYIWDDFLSAEEVAQLRDCIPENWKKARIGRNDETQREESIRSDKIQWLKPDMGQPVELFLEKMEQIRLEANRHFYLGLFEYEAHFAKYERGDFYQKHLDCFQGNENRRLTTVFYMNEEWSAQDAGELVVYDLDDNHIATIPPKGGRLFVFLSERFPHEVLPTNAERFSIAGWFRINGVKDNQLDIAR
ncbi:2OG-Fe(II) oxygenase [Vibrio panuliri]|uniref:SM-20 protein n=1 Tax=Vibrio panuliri TaxID=1381081 RepID=A0A1Q9HIR2_9VIBR|nr:2OG-Fe(II) oxygenase [Vibrio panuliri]KAB1454252.1 SM-20 protein [Vibrio panuliri]OLQ88944.1 SM-20 protein [Vibrio panuliri]OLQ90214.1 SM-20 protein [Vibrio panuliri]